MMNNKMVLGIFVFLALSVFHLDAQDGPYPWSLDEDREKVVRSIIDNMVYVEGGTFMMGCTPDQQPFCKEENIPLKTVEVESFYISKYEFTRRDWEAVTGNDWSPSNDLDTSHRCPKTWLTWYDVQEIMKQLAVYTGKKFRLPTEAEWEYAARGGKYGKPFKYSGSNDIDEVAWYKENSDWRRHEVGQKKPNELGLYDMSGNVWEWCSDPYFVEYRRDITGPYVNRPRVYKGGRHLSYAETCQVSNSHWDSATDQTDWLGFRLALDSHE